MKGIHHKVL